MIPILQTKAGENSPKMWILNPSFHRLLPPSSWPEGHIGSYVYLTGQVNKVCYRRAVQSVVILDLMGFLSFLLLSLLYDFGEFM